MLMDRGGDYLELNYINKGIFKGKNWFERDINSQSLGYQETSSQLGWEKNSFQGQVIP